MHLLRWPAPGRFLPGLLRCLVWLAGASSLNSAGAPAADVAPAARLSLAESRRLAFERNWDLLAAAAGVEAALAQKIVAREFPNPALSVSTSLISVDGHPNSTPSSNGFWDRSYDTVFAVTQLFEIGGKRRQRKASAQAGYQAARAQLLDAKRTLDLAALKAYVAAAQAEENGRVLLQSAATLRQEAELADVRLKAGAISSADHAQIEIAAKRFALDAATAQANAAQARVALQVLLGVPRPSGDLVLTDRLDDLGAAPAPKSTGSLALRRPDVLAAEASLRKAEADLLLQKANRIPDPTVLGQYEHEPPDMPNTIGFGISFPLPLWNRNRGNILAMEAARNQARLELEKTQAQAAAEIVSATLAYDDARKKWQSYREEIRPRSAQVRETMAYAYQKGSASLLDMLIAERNDNEIRLAAAQAAADTAVAAGVLEAATTEIKTSMMNP